MDRDGFGRGQRCITDLNPCLTMHPWYVKASLFIIIAYSKADYLAQRFFVEAIMVADWSQFLENARLFVTSKIGSKRLSTSVSSRKLTACLCMPHIQKLIIDSDIPLAELEEDASCFLVCPCSQKLDYRCSLVAFHRPSRELRLA